MPATKKHVRNIRKIYDIFLCKKCKHAKCVENQRKALIAELMDEITQIRQEIKRETDYDR